MRAHETIRKAALGKYDNRILSVISRELVVAEGRYHRSCYRNCTRNISVRGDKKEDSEYTKYFPSELQGYDYIRTDLLQNLRIVRLSESYAMSISFVNSQGEREMPESYYFTLPSTPTFKILSVYRLEKVASSELQDSDLLRAKDVGEDVYKAFREQRLECDSPNVKFHDIMNKAKLKTFTDLNKETKVKASNNQEVVLNAEKRLFAQMIVIAVCRNLQMNEVLAHPLGPLTSMDTG